MFFVTMGYEKDFCIYVSSLFAKILSNKGSLCIKSVKEHI
jgi:hypothetical protein